jgi:phosphoribosyl-ATP pyrophosphohydrolase/phosphoribosyl-AMP cyclohydrolase
MGAFAEPDFAKMDGLLPAIVQDARTQTVLMLGYMNAEALAQTRATGKVTFFSRSKQCLWVKGETSGHFLQVRDILLDCDKDTFLILADPVGPVCHTGADTCFFAPNSGSPAFLSHLEATIKARKYTPDPSSHTSQMFEKGIDKIAQKFGEEAVEVLIEAKNHQPDRLANETADLLYRLLCVLVEKELPLAEVIRVLEERHK